MFFVCRSVGVSNFGVQHLEGLIKAGRPAPSVNQIELHPLKQQQHIVDSCRQHGITVMGYSPLAKGRKMNDEKLLAMANRFVHFSFAVFVLIRNYWTVEMFSSSVKACMLFSIQYA